MFALTRVSACGDVGGPGQVRIIRESRRRIVEIACEPKSYIATTKV
jgi:hypothetical protein